MKSGWIKIYRQVQECCIWEKNEPFDSRSAWIDLLLSATHKEKKLIINNKTYLIKRGEFMTSILKLSQRWKWSKGKTTRYLNLLESEQMITTTRTPFGTLITIEKYGDFQHGDSVNDTGVDTGVDTTVGTTVEPPVEPTVDTGVGTGVDTTVGTQNKNIRIKECKECKEVKNERMKEEITLTVSNNTVCQTQNVRRVVEAWNELEKYGIKPVSKISSTSKRYKSAVARLRENGLEDILFAIEKIKNSDFLQGKTNKGWMITFDWFVSENNFQKVFDGNYDNKNYENESGYSYSKKDSREEQFDNLMEQIRRDAENDN